jgi:hypothetical protein
MKFLQYTERKKIIDVLIGVMAVAMITSVVFYLSEGSKYVSLVSTKVQLGVTSQEPQKTDFGTSTPTDFPTDIPIEKGVKVEQSYGLNYVGQKQLTIVFLSAKTVKENYSLYSNFLTKQGWSVSNKYESANVSSLYGTKESNDINITIVAETSSPAIRSQVSISVLKK